MSTLYVIGNGFDLHHELPTSLVGFREFSKYSAFHRLYENGVFKMLADQSPDDHWNQLEQNLANFDVDELIELASQYYSDDPHENQFVYEVETSIDAITTGLTEALHNYLAVAEKKAVRPERFLRLDTNAHFISFNYTDTLERIYKIPSDRICYIHGKLNSPVGIVIGHAMKQSSVEPRPPIDLTSFTEEEMDAFADSYSPDYERAILEAHEYFRRSYKDTDACIKDSHSFLQSLSDIDNVIILGHSLAEIDQIYFEHINQNAGTKCKWWATYFPCSQKDVMFKRLEEIVGESNRINVFEMSQLTIAN